MIGIIFATIEEARPFIEAAGARHTDGGDFIALLPGCSAMRIAVSGMGRGAAAVACTRLIDECGAETIINAGAAGALRDGMAVGECYAAESSVDGAAAHSNSSSLPLCSFPGMATAAVVTVEAGLFDNEKRALLSQRGELVDMELRGIAEECSARHIPLYAIKAVTDAARSGDKETLRKNLATASRVLAEKLLPFARQLAAGRARGPRSFLNFTRIEHTLFSLPLLFAGAWLGADGDPSFTTMILVVIVGFGARLFGMSVNRIFDREIDAQNPRTWRRELPSGAMSLSAGTVSAVTGLAIYFAGCAALGGLCLTLSWIPVMPLALYTFLKRFTPYCHYGIGLCLMLAPLGAFVATAGELPLRSDIVLLGAFTFFWMSGFDILYAMQDTESDRRTGVKSIPAAVGDAKAGVIAMLTHQISLIMLVALWREVGGGFASGAALAVAALAFTSAHFGALKLEQRFFPLSAIASAAASLVVLFA